MEGETEMKLITIHGQRIIVPKGARKHVLNMMHISHQGQEKTKEMAKELFWWPAMNEDIKQMVERCESCKTHLPSNSREPIEEMELSFAPMSHVAADLCSINGTTWLVMVDRFSGWPFAAPLKSQTTEEVAKKLETWFNVFGNPTSLRADNGPCFRDTFDTFLSTKAIIRTASSPYNSQSNGLCEAAVGVVKALMKKKDPKEDPEAVLGAFRNTPRQDGISPAQLFLGRRMKDNVPRLRSQLIPESGLFEAGRNKRDAAKETKDASINKRAKTLEPLNVGDKVTVQSHLTQLWDRKATVQQITASGHSYILKDEQGREFQRNRFLLRRDFKDETADNLDVDFKGQESADESDDYWESYEDEEGYETVKPRRSARILARANAVRPSFPSTSHLNTSTPPPPPPPSPAATWDTDLRCPPSRTPRTLPSPSPTTRTSAVVFTSWKYTMPPSAAPSSSSSSLPSSSAAVSWHTGGAPGTREEQWQHSTTDSPRADTTAHLSACRPTDPISAAPSSPTRRAAPSPSRCQRSLQRCFPTGTLSHSDRRTTRWTPRSLSASTTGASARSSGRTRRSSERQDRHTAPTDPPTRASWFSQAIDVVVDVRRQRGTKLVQQGFHSGIHEEPITSQDRYLNY